MVLTIRKHMVYFLLGLSVGVSTLIASNQQLAQAQTCTSLEVVGGVGTVVEKTVSPPSALLTRSNWNTDFIVPSNFASNQFVATIVAIDAGDYDIEMYLKYPDGSADEVYNVEALELEAGETLTVEGRPRSGRDPYQVNLRIGGIQAIGNTYQLSVAGCS